MKSFSLTWEAPEFEHRPKDISWYWLVIISGVVLFGLAIWQRNFLFALFIVLAEVLMLIWANRTPMPVRFMITEHGVRIGTHTFYARAHIEAFSIVPHEHTHWYDLVIYLDQRLLPIITIKLPPEHVTEVQEHLRELYPQVEHQESFVEALERLIGF